MRRRLRIEVQAPPDPGAQAGPGLLKHLYRNHRTDLGLRLDIFADDHADDCGQFVIPHRRARETTGHRSTFGLHVLQLHPSAAWTPSSPEYAGRVHSVPAARETLHSESMTIQS